MQPSAIGFRTTLPSSLRRESTTQATVRALQDYIVDQRLQPGDSLPTEATLLETLCVSRSSLREALRVLESLDLIEVHHGKGMRVGPMSLAPLINSVLFRTRLTAGDDLRTLRQVLATRKSLDLSVAEELTQVLRGQRRPELRRHVDAMRAAFARGESFADHDRAFHLDLLDTLNNQVLSELVIAMWEIHYVAVPLLALPEPYDLQQTVEAHDQILDALEAGDVEAYREAVAVHFAPLERALDRSTASLDSGGPTTS